MAKIKSKGAKVLDGLEESLKAHLRGLGFRHRSRTFTRTASEGLMHLINFQMGAYDPPGTVEIPGFRVNLYGRFTVNLGVFVPEVAEYLDGIRHGKTIHEYDCCLRARLGTIGPEQRDLWWDLSETGDVLSDVMERLSRDAFPWFDRFGTRDSLLSELNRESVRSLTTVPRIVSAIILAKRGDTSTARALLDAQIEDAAGRPHAQYVQELAARLGL